MNTNLQETIQIFPTNYPNNILLGTQLYNLQFNVKNNLNTKEKFQFKFSGVGLNFEIPDFLNQLVEIDANQTIEFVIGLKPTLNGQAKIIIDSIHHIDIQYTELVTKVRLKIDQKIITEALLKTFFTPKSFNYELPSKYKGSLQDISKFDATNAIIGLSEPSILNETPVTELSSKEKDEKKLDISKNVYNLDKEYAFEIISELPDSSTKEQVICDFILSYASIDFNKAVTKLHLIKNSMLKDQTLIKIIGSIGIDHFKEAVTLSFQINDPLVKDDILLWLIELSYKSNLDDSLSLLGNISNSNFRAGSFYNIIKYLFENDKEKCNSLIDTFVDSITSLGDNNLLKYSIAIAGALNDPDYANNLIALLPSNVNESIKSELHDSLWHQVEDIVSRKEQIPVSSVYYTFNTAAKPDFAMKMVNTLGGNISENLLSDNFSSFIGVICPFGFNFPIFPTIERAYTEIKIAKQKSFYYMLIPTKVKSEEDFLFVQTLLNQWFVSNESKFNNKVYLFNLDFIPYLSKPTIIMGSDVAENTVIESVTKKVFGDTVNFIIDNGLFKDGMVYHILRRILPQNKFKIINLVMTYDFLNDYTLFRRFMEDFIK